MKLTSAKYALLVFIVVFSNFYGIVSGLERVIKPNDAIEIFVSESEALTQVVVVKPDGTIDYPALQDFPVDGITLPRLQEMLVAQLSRYMENTPLVLVRFSESFPIKVNVLGQVARPGQYVIPNTTNLQGAISAAGGFIQGAQLSKIKLIHSLSDKKNGFELVNMEAFYLNADPSVLPLLKAGDTIVVPGNPLSTKVSILGAVERPGSYEIFFKSTLLDLLFMAGGAAHGANLKKITIVSTTDKTTRQVSIDAKGLLKRQNYENIPVVLPGDIVYVPKRFFNWRGFMNVMRDLTTFATLFYFISLSSS